MLFSRGAGRLEGGACEGHVRDRGRAGGGRGVAFSGMGCIRCSCLYDRRAAGAWAYFFCVELGGVGGTFLTSTTLLSTVDVDTAREFIDFGRNSLLVGNGSGMRVCVSTGSYHNIDCTTGTLIESVDGIDNSRTAVASGRGTAVLIKAVKRSTTVSRLVGRGHVGKGLLGNGHRGFVVALMSRRLIVTKDSHENAVCNVCRLSRRVNISP